MRAMMQLPVLSFFTHDSIAVGQDGPSHQPIEQIGQLRAIVGNTVFRPCDYKELVAGYEYAIKANVPVSFALTRQDIPQVENTFYDGALMGGYILKENSPKPDIVLVASGSEVPLAIDAMEELSKKHAVNVVSMPSLEVFEKQTKAYKQKILPKDALIVYVEMSNDTKPLNILPKNSYLYGVGEYQFSGDGETVLEKAGFTTKALTKFVETKLSQK